MPGTAWPHPVITVTSISIWLSFIQPSGFCFSLSAMPGIFIREACCSVCWLQADLVSHLCPCSPMISQHSTSYSPAPSIGTNLHLAPPGRGKSHESTRCSHSQVPKLLLLKVKCVISVTIAGTIYFIYLFFFTFFSEWSFLMKICDHDVKAHSHLTIDVAQ